MVREVPWRRSQYWVSKEGPKGLSGSQKTNGPEEATRMIDRR